MSPVYFWVRVIAGVILLLCAVVMWVRGQQLHSLALRWLSLAEVALALGAGSAAVGSLANPRTFYLWSDLQFAAWPLAVCMLVVAGVIAVRELLRGSGMQR